MAARSHDDDAATRFQMTPAWKASVKEKLAERGMTKSDLAAAIGVSKSVITLMLGKQTSSGYVPAVCRAIGVPMPVLGANDDLLAVFGKLSPEDQKTLLLMARRMLK